ncbi:unnamed protein product [Hermetia illucens]|uniref:Ig-like domain-containing protein n=1 Tax=Hermetia illucens TaxID=343691 RepID=A0A7R8UXA7_HERIL|nr:unnamed protein product [Hermetia illucens]
MTACKRVQNEEPCDSKKLDPSVDEQSHTETGTDEQLPYFADEYTTYNVSSQLSANVYLHCRVNDLQGKTVSWMRRKGEELTLITFGKHTYSSDSRYSLEFEEPNDWRLFIQNVKKKDEGPYECQISSHPPLVLVVYLSVVEPHIDILDERLSPTPEKYYKAGSTIELQCMISDISQPATYVIWKHGQKVLNYDTNRGGISVKTDLLPKRIASKLYIANSNYRDSGNYTCILNNDTKATVVVHVLSTEQPAAMQHSGVADVISYVHTIAALLCLTIIR